MPEYIDVNYLRERYGLSKEKAYYLLRMLNAEKRDNKLCVPCNVWAEFLEAWIIRIGLFNCLISKEHLVPYR